MVMTVTEKVAESNRIEGIFRPPTPEELNAHCKLMDVDEMGIADLVAFVKVYQPDARLRDVTGLDVQVGDYVAPPGCPAVRLALEVLLDNANCGADPWETHVAYESLHPFTDGNGRSGRALWYWQMHPRTNLGFLHSFYYQTLRHNQSE